MAIRNIPFILFSLFFLQPGFSENPENLYRFEDASSQGDTYQWQQISPQSLLLIKDGKPLVQYEFPVFDNSRREYTLKPYHHIYDPETGHLITKGTGGLYPHHRGIFYGYNKISIDGGPAFDTWHCHNGEHTVHKMVAAQFSDQTMGGHIVKIDWNDTQGKTFANETRIVRVSYEAGEMSIDFYSTLESTGGVVELNGDRQHAGVHFRASNRVSENADATRFTRPANLAHIPADKEIEGPEMLNLPWDAMTFPLNGQKYTVVYMAHPRNPQGAEMSERKYGRFGQFFPYTLAPGKPLVVQYRIIVLENSNPSPEVIDQWYRAFAGL